MCDSLVGQIKAADWAVTQSLEKLQNMIRDASVLLGSLSYTCPACGERYLPHTTENNVCGNIHYYQCKCGADATRQSVLLVAHMPPKDIPKEEA